MKLSNEQIDKSLIGEIILEELKRSKIKNLLLNGNFKTIPIEGYPLSLIDLPNGQFVSGTDDSVILLNENLQSIKKVWTGGNSFCALSRRNEIYVSVYQRHCIILFDLNLNQLENFGSRGDGNNQFYFPEGLCCHENYLYICDNYNQRFQILTLDFDYVSTIITDYHHNPIRIQISETTISLSSNEAIFFYDLKSRTLKSKYYFGRMELNYIDSTFYGSNYIQKKFYLFDSDGNFIEEIAWNEKLSKKVSSFSSGSLCRNKEDLYMIDFDGKRLFKFNKKIKLKFFNAI